MITGALRANREDVDRDAVNLLTIEPGCNYLACFSAFKSPQVGLGNKTG
jgi:hypothetical protein